MKTTRMLLIGLALLIAMVGPLARSAVASTSSDAQSATDAFINTFWNSNTKYFYTNSDHQIHSAHAYGPQNGLYTDFWWEAQMWEVVMDAYQRTNSAAYRQMIDDVYDGFVAQYPTWSDNYNDDLGWWALACIRAYNITGETRFRDESVSLFNSIWSYNSSTYGGGIWWTRDGSSAQKNVATNAPAVITAVKLKEATGDTTYLQKAQTLFSWMTATLVNNGHVYDHIEGSGSGSVVKWDFSYNSGTYIGAALALYGDTNNAAYLSDATSAADWATSYLTNGGTPMYEGVDDAGGFKMILCRYLNQLVSVYGQTKYLPFLQHNATQAWNHRRSADNLIGPDWSASAPSTYLQSLTAAAGVDILNVVSPDGYEGVQPENGMYEAENASATAINAESSYGGFTGRGYLAGWNQSTQSVDFHVNVPSAGAYELRFRYAAGAGSASRKVVVNGGTVAGNLAFPSTGAWSSWNSVTLNGVNLSQGSNDIAVRLDPTQGNGNYLNLDNMAVSAQLQAEAGTLHNLSVESTYSGYTGNGYVAGWNTDGQWVDLHPNVAKAGTYTLTFRYAAGAGNASRYIYVNGTAVATNLSFPGTGNWTTWNTVVIAVPLNAGDNTVSVIFNSSQGSANYLNLDEMTLQYVN